jgi:hypothetical protein
MKNFLIKPIMFALLIIGFISCNEQDAMEGIADRTDLHFTVNPTSRAAQRSDIKRGNIYAWVKDVTIKAQGHLTGHVSEDTFNIVPDSTQGASHTPKLKDVELGINTITASTTTDSPKLATIYPVNLQGVNLNNLFKTYEDKNPYATYDSESEHNITRNGGPITLDMTTQHGRRISIFRLGDSQYVQRNFTFVLNSYVDNQLVGQGTARAKGGLVFYWSNHEALKGKKAIHIVHVKKGNRVVKVFRVEEEIHASTSNSCLYTVLSSRELLKDEQAFKFNWQPWVNDDCDCP